MELEERRIKEEQEKQKLLVIEMQKQRLLEEHGMVLQ